MASFDLASLALSHVFFSVSRSPYILLLLTLLLIVKV